MDLFQRTRAAMPKRKKARCKKIGYRKVACFRKSTFMGNLRKASKAFLIDPAGSRCQICGYDKCIGNLTFHHKNPSTKQFNISSVITKHNLKMLVCEASKCIVACHNCHGEIHAGIVPAARVNAIPLLDFSHVRLPIDVVKWYVFRKKCIEKK